MHRRILLTEDEMRELDDGQGWYEDGDECYLGWVCGTRDTDLCVNGRTHDNWCRLDQLPVEVRSRLEDGEEYGEAG